MKAQCPNPGRVMFVCPLCVEAFTFDLQADAVVRCPACGNASQIIGMLDPAFLTKSTADAGWGSAWAEPLDAVYGPGVLWHAALWNPPGR